MKKQRETEYFQFEIGTHMVLSAQVVVFHLKIAIYGTPERPITASLSKTRWVCNKHGEFVKNTMSL